MTESLFRIRTIGAHELKVRLDEIRHRIPQVVDNNPAMTRAAIDEMHKQFVKERDPEDEKWAPLSPRTKKGRQILYQTGNLLKSIDRIRGNPTGYAIATGAGFRVGITSIRYTREFKRGGSRIEDTAAYGPIHQRGYGVPRRSFIGLTPAARNRLVALARRTLNKLLEV